VTRQHAAECAALLACTDAKLLGKYDTDSRPFINLVWSGRHLQSFTAAATWTRRGAAA
jgi:hypothetical protein